MGLSTSSTPLGLSSTGVGASASSPRRLPTLSRLLLIKLCLANAPVLPRGNLLAEAMEARPREFRFSTVALVGVEEASEAIESRWLGMETVVDVLSRFELELAVDVGVPFVVAIGAGCGFGATPSLRTGELSALPGTSRDSRVLAPRRSVGLAWLGAMGKRVSAAELRSRRCALGLGAGLDARLRLAIARALSSIARRRLLSSVLIARGR